MIRGVGIDTATISDFVGLCDCEDASGERGEAPEAPLDPLESTFALYTFTEAERSQLRKFRQVFRAMAGLFAVKEATFKAVAHLLPERTFDFRIVEVLHREDGWPYVNATPELREVLDMAGVSDLQVSITNEGDMATAIVIAQ